MDKSTSYPSPSLSEMNYMREYLYTNYNDDVIQSYVYSDKM